MPATQVTQDISSSQQAGMASGASLPHASLLATSTFGEVKMPRWNTRPQNPNEANVGKNREVVALRHVEPSTRHWPCFFGSEGLSGNPLSWPAPLPARGGFTPAARWDRTAVAETPAGLGATSSHAGRQGPSNWKEIRMRAINAVMHPRLLGRHPKPTSRAHFTPTKTQAAVRVTSRPSCDRKGQSESNGRDAWRSAPSAGFRESPAHRYQSEGEGGELGRATPSR